jgi:DNA invertase Pin-like site-specific DNA recombinase
MQAYGYIRVSTDRQVEQGYGLDTQRSTIKKYCKENDIELMDIFVDEGISGTEVESRTGLTEMLARFGSEKNCVMRVVVQHTNRIWRDEFPKAMIKREFMKMGVDVISIQQSNYSVYTKDPNDKLINGIMELLDEYDRTTINIKLARGRLTKVMNGVKGSGNPPYGYSWSYKEKQSAIVIDNDKANVVKEIFSKYLELKSVERVRLYLDGKGYKTNTNINFSTTAICNVLNNQFYLGKVKWSDNLYDGNHEPIINPIVFGKAQAQLKRNKKGRIPKNVESAG